MHVKFPPSQFMGKDRTWLQAWIDDRANSRKAAVGSFLTSEPDVDDGGRRLRQAYFVCARTRQACVDRSVVPTHQWNNSAVALRMNSTEEGMMPRYQQVPA